MSKAKKTNNLLKLLQEKIDTDEFFSFELYNTDFDYFPFVESNNDNLVKAFSKTLRQNIYDFSQVPESFKKEVIDVYLNEYLKIKKFLEKNKISLMYRERFIFNVETLIEKRLNQTDLNHNCFFELSLSTYSNSIIHSLENYIFTPSKMTFTNDLEYYKLLNYWFKKICGRI